MEGPPFQPLLGTWPGLEISGTGAISALAGKESCLLEGWGLAGLGSASSRVCG